MTRFSPEMRERALRMPSEGRLGDVSLVLCR